MQNKQNQAITACVPLNDEESAECSALEERLRMKRAEVIRAALKIVYNMDNKSIMEMIEIYKPRVWNRK